MSILAQSRLRYHFIVGIRMDNIVNFMDNLVVGWRGGLHNFDLRRRGVPHDLWCLSWRREERLVMSILSPNYVNLVSILGKGSWAGWFDDLVILGRNFETLIGNWGVLLSLGVEEELRIVLRIVLMRVGG